MMPSRLVQAEAMSDEVPPQVDKIVYLPFLVDTLDVQVIIPGNPVLDWPDEVQALTYPSLVDGTLQPAMYFAPPDTGQPVPLLVALHTWATDYTQSSSGPYAQWAIANGWVFIAPNFRGPNNQPSATGSDLVVGDIYSAVVYAKAHANVDPHRIYLIGASGGGYTALQVLGKYPDIWAGVSAWVPISDIKAWYYETVSNPSYSHYAADIVNSCGGIPGASKKVDDEYYARSPIHFLENAIGVPVDLNAGIHDGHQGSVPISQTLRAFNSMVPVDNRITEDQIQYFVNNQQVPPDLVAPVEDPMYGIYTPLFRRQVGVTRVTIFEGAHDTVFWAGLNWLAHQRKP